MGKKQRNKRMFVPSTVEKTSPLVKLITAFAVLALATPLIPSLYLPSYYLQIVVLQLLVEAMVVCWLILVVRDARFRPDWRSPILWGAVVLMGTMLISLCFAIDPAYSFWSRPGRMTGVVNYLHYYAWLLVLLGVYRKPENFGKLLKASALVSTVIALLGIHEWFGDKANSVQATLGNPSFFGVYMMLHFFVGVYLFVTAKTKFSKVLSVATIIAALISVFLSGSRGAVLMLFFSFAVALLVYILFSSARKKYKIALVSVVLVMSSISVGSVLLLRSNMMSNWTNSHLSGPTHRLVTKNFGDDRWVLWRYAFLGVAERPIFGWGMEQFEISFYKYYDPASDDIDIMNERFADRAHNAYLDILVASGAVGLLGYLAFMAAVVASAWLAFRRSSDIESRRQTVAVGAVVFAYFAYNLILFETAYALFIALLCFALVAAHYRSLRVSEESEIVQELKNSGVSVGLPIIVVMIAVAMLVNILPMLKYRQVIDSQNLVDTNRIEALKKYDQALNGYDPYKYDSRMRAMEKLLKWSENVSLKSSQMEALLSYTAPYVANAAENRSYNARFQIAAAAMFRMLGDYDSTALDIAEKFVRDVIEDYPNRADAYFEYGEINLTRGNPDAAIENIELALERVPNRNSRVRHYMTFRLASAYAMKCDGEQTKKYFDEAVSPYLERHKDTRLMIDIGQNCGIDSEFAWAEDHTDLVLTVYPDHPEVLKAAAKIYAASGEWQKAENILQRLGKRDPAAAEEIAEQINGIIQAE